MTLRSVKAERFFKLHVPGQPLVLFNIWDRCSAVAVAAGGAHAIATGSWAVAHANGYTDGEHIPLATVVDNLTRIVQAVAELPVTVDIESGYARTPDQVADTVARTIQAGAVACNLEDSHPETGRLRGIDEQVERIGHARRGAGAAKSPYFINARTDVFFQAAAGQHDDAMVDQALARAHAYAAAGADGLFVPGLADLRLIERLAREAPLPLNIMATSSTPPLAQLARAGVARVSHGADPYRQMMKMLELAARAAMVV